MSKTVPFANLEIVPERVLIIGEYTTNDGPYCDDYFVFVMMKDGVVETTPVASVLTGDSLVKLGEALGAELQLELANRTDCSSNALYPPNVKGQPLFRTKQTKLSRSWGARLLGWPSSVEEVEIDPDIRMKAIQWLGRHEGDTPTSLTA